MRPIDKILDALRNNPDGLTSLELGRIVYGGTGYNYTVLSSVYQKAKSLMKYGLVSLTYEERPNALGHIVNTAVWRAVQ